MSEQRKNSGPSSEFHREVAETATDALIIIDERSRILFVNPAAERIFGYPVEEMLGQDLAMLMPEALRELHRSAVARYLETGVRHLNWESTELTGLHKDGHEIPVEVSFGELCQDGRRLFTGVVRDITERKRKAEALRQSEARFRSVAETTETLIFLTDGSRFLYVNPASERVTGYPRDTLLTMDPWQVVHPDFREVVRQRSAARLRGEMAPSRYEFQILTRGGEARWLDFSASLTEFEGRHVILGTAVDVTERKRMEGELRESESRFRAIAETTAAAVWIHDGSTFLYVNPTLEELTGHCKEELRSMSPFDLVHSDFREATRQRWEARQHGDSEPMSYELKIVTKSGAERWGLFNTSTMQVEGRRAVLGIAFDITDRKRAEELQAALVVERKRAEEALRFSETRNRKLVESAPYGIYVATFAGRFVSVNSALVKLLGYESAEEVLRLDIPTQVFVYPAERAQLLRDYRETGQVDPTEVQWKRRDGRVIRVKLSGRAISEGTDESTLFEMFAEDVTEHRVVEDQLRQSQKMEAVGRLAGGIAHDFNNLLTVIGGHSQLVLEETGPTSALADPLRQVLNATDRAASLTRQLLAFSRQQVLEPKILDLNTVVGNMEQLLRRLIGEDVTMVTRLDESLFPIKADPGQLEQVIMNLAVNARDAMPRGGTLTIETANIEVDTAFAAQHPPQPPGPYVMLVLTDTGVGMDETTLSRIFEPFFTTKAMGKGTGLGLSTVYGIVRQSGGHIWADSRPGIGSSFRVFLHRAAESVEGETEQTSLTPLSRGAETILLVEDEEDVRALVSQVLQGQGYTVLETPRGAEALIMCERHPGPIHLLLTDVILESASGQEVAERVLGLRPGIRTLFMSGYTSDAILRYGELAPGTVFLQKPFSPNELLHKIEEVLTSHA